MVSRKFKGSLFVAALATLSACVPEGERQSSLTSSALPPEESLSVVDTDESSINTSQSSECSFESSSDDKVYFLVSIYQSYPERPDALGRSGVRFDTSFRIEEGKPLYTTKEEMNAFTSQFNPVFEPYGEAFSLIPLFYDKECTVYYGPGTPILSDSTFYYYMAG